jgi:hypothetical protein
VTTFRTIDPNHRDIEVIPMTEYRRLRLFCAGLLLAVAFLAVTCAEKAARAEGNGQRIAVLEGRG